MAETKEVPRVINALDYHGGLKPCARFYHDAWGRDDNYLFFDDAFRHSSRTPTATPRFYVLVSGDEIIGCYGIVTMDFVSRQDLHPWLAGFFVSDSHRGQGYGQRLLEHAADEARRMELSAMYLTTELDGYYERHGWERLNDAFDLNGKPTKIYRLRIS